MATTLKKVIQSAPKMRGSLPIKAKKGASIKKAQDGDYVTQEGNTYTNTRKVSTSNGPRYYQGKSMDMNVARKMAALKGRANSADSIPKAKVPTKALEALNKAKNGKWMQKAAASIKRRGTAGKCTPITKPGCTGKAKALAKTFKAIAKKNKK
jgi:hypothetical protein